MVPSCLKRADENDADPPRFPRSYAVSVSISRFVWLWHCSVRAFDSALATKKICNLSHTGLTLPVSTCATVAQRLGWQRRRLMPPWSLLFDGMQTPTSIEADADRASWPSYHRALEWSELLYGTVLHDCVHNSDKKDLLRSRETYDDTRFEERSA